MNEFIEKLIGRLEEEKSKGYYDSNSVIGEKNVWSKAIQIVNQLAEEHKDDIQTIDVSELLGEPEQVKQSNADRLRAMSDEELAEHFSELIRDTRRNEYLTGVGDWLLWLQSEAE